MKHFFLSSLSFILFLTAFSQQPEQQPDNVTMNAAVSEGLYGKLLDNATGKPIAAASVQIYVPGTNTDSLFDGMLTRPNGEFRFERLPVADSIKLVISALGYQPQEQYVRAGTNQTNRPAGFQRDLGNISLQTDVKQLSEVVVSATRPALQMGIDRKIFDVSKSLLAAGGTAVDIMKNIPSVSVDIEGNVELRNSTPQIFVDGRPTILTLDQIPADHIDKIELITNPSAKFDAASSGGIINVVLKKNKRIGLNGVISLSGGTPELFSGNLNINLRQGKFNFFASVGHNQSGGIARGQTLRQNKKGGVVTDYFNQFSKNERDRNFNSLRFGTDIFLSNRNTITISQDFSKGKFGNVEMQNQEYLDASRVLTYSGLRRSDGSSKFDRGSTRLNFKHNFPKEGKELTADINYNYGSRTSLSDINTLYFKPDGSQYRQPSLVWNDGSNEENQLTIQADYVNPINESTKIETGLRSFTSTFKSYYNAYADDNGQAEKLPLSNNYAYDQAVTAAYFTFSKNLKSFSYQLGLRGEHSKFDGELVDSAYKFGYEYPGSLKNIWDGLFPSVYLTKKLNESNEMQFNYSRRIRRPQFWQLNPFVDINDPANLRQGNPALRPEFINSFEVNYNNTYKQGNFLAVVYFRNNPDDITEYSDTITAAQYQQFANAAIDPNAILNTFINASTTNRYGAEFTLQHKIGKNFDITPTVNLQYRTVSAKVNDLVLDNKGFNWEAKLITNYKIETERPSFFNNFGFQAIVDYESPQVIPQGKNIAEFQVDLAFRKDFMKNKKASLTLAVSDLFNSQRWGTIYDTEQFYQDSYRRWNVRNFRLTFSYKFGDNKFSLFNNNRRRENDDD
ncbi:MAG: TonB-dependent receptor [Ferruginibacter sp.]|nr:TonB-dependent receptor [Ferruginibacter sp.]